MLLKQGIGLFEGWGRTLTFLRFNRLPALPIDFPFEYVVATVTENLVWNPVDKSCMSVYFCF